MDTGTLPVVVVDIAATVLVSTKTTGFAGGGACTEAANDAPPATALESVPGPSSALILVLVVVPTVVADDIDDCREFPPLFLASRLALLVPRRIGAGVELITVGAGITLASGDAEVDANTGTAAVSTTGAGSAVTVTTDAD
jgi:hypothetical protein